jgi:NifB/MoaA-like Fe-S oxidoreductase
MADEARLVDGLSVEVREVQNTLFGSSITVSGLMSGRDIVRVVRERPTGLVVLPRNAFGFEGERTLDEWTVEAIEKETGVQVRLGRTAADLVSLSTST